MMLLKRLTSALKHRVKDRIARAAFLGVQTPINEPERSRLRARAFLRPAAVCCAFMLGELSALQSISAPK